MIDPQKAIQKLRRPPAAHNWVKSLRKRRDASALALYNFAVNGPRHSLQKVSEIIGFVVFDDLTMEDAQKCLSKISDPKVRAYGHEILRAIVPWIKERELRGVQIFQNLTEFYRVSSVVSIPVRPTFVVRDGETITPYFVICWAKMDLDIYQKRILSTVIADAILRLEEFEGSDARILCVPRYRGSKTERFVSDWWISEYPPLDELEKSELFGRYEFALSDAEKMIIRNLG